MAHQPLTSSFEELLAQLRQAHQSEVEELRRQRDSLHSYNGKSHQKFGIGPEGTAQKPCEPTPCLCNLGDPDEVSGEEPLSITLSTLKPSQKVMPKLKSRRDAGDAGAARDHATPSAGDAGAARDHATPSAGDAGAARDRATPSAESVSEEESAGRDQGVTTTEKDGGASDAVEPTRSQTPRSALESKVNVMRRRYSAKRKGSAIFESTEPKNINFQQRCMARYPGRSWKQLSGKEQVAIIREELRPRHFILNPRGSFMRYWDTLLGVFLTFVALITPYEVVFLPKVEWGFFVVNRAVDLVFAIDIFLQFFLPVEIQQPHRGGTILMRDPVVFRMRYLKTWFFLDMVSIFPFEVLSLVMSESSSFMRRAKMVRCLRLIKLAKLLRILRASKLQQRWKNAVGMRVGTQKLIRFCMGLLLLSHWMACLWGVVGLTLGTELCDGAGELVSFGSGGLEVGQVSWVTTLYLGGKTSPDSPCNHFDVYIAALHWSVMTLTSIGYGDIVPVRMEEYIVGILCMLAGGVLWAYVIGSVCSIISNVSPVERNFEMNTDLLNLAMEESKIPHHKRQEYREYLREAKAYDRRVCFGQVAENFSPMLRKRLLLHATRGLLGSVYYFCGEGVSEAFLMDLAAHLVPRLFSRFETMDAVRHLLCLIDRGTVAHGGLILIHPSVFNDDFIVKRARYREPTSTISLTYTQLLVLSRQDLEQVLEQHEPELAKRIWTCATKRAFCRAVQLTSEAYAEWQRSSPKAPRLSLAQAFDKFKAGETFESLGRCQRLSLVPFGRLSPDDSASPYAWTSPWSL